VGRSHGGSSAHIHGYLRVSKSPTLCLHTPLNLTNPQRIRRKHIRILSQGEQIANPLSAHTTKSHKPPKNKAEAHMNTKLFGGRLSHGSTGLQSNKSRASPKCTPRSTYRSVGRHLLILHPAASATEIIFPGRRTSTRSQICLSTSTCCECLFPSWRPFVAAFWHCTVSVHCPWETAHNCAKNKETSSGQNTDAQARAAADLPFGTSDNGTCDCQQSCVRLLRVVHP
jgi:hypothetical protein